MKGRPVTPDFSPPPPPPATAPPPLPPAPQPPPVPGTITQYLIIILLAPFYLAGGLIAMAASDHRHVSAAVTTIVTFVVLSGITRYLNRLPPGRRPFGLRTPVWITLVLLAFLFGFLSGIFLEYDAHRPHHRFE
jgi:hypothetical protein